MVENNREAKNEVPAGYVNPLRSIDDNPDHRRFTDGVLHWQCRPKVYPFTRESGNNKSASLPENQKKDVSMYVSEFVPKAVSVRKFRPSSMNRRNNPHPNVAFHVKHMLNQGVPVVRTRMTLEEFNRRPVNSPYISNSHRVYRRYKSTEIDRAKPLQQTVESATGIVPEINKPEVDPSETRLFPVIPRNARLTADKAHQLTTSVIKPRKNKYQPHLSGASSSITGESLPQLHTGDAKRPGLKPLSGYPNSLQAGSWDGAPLETARTTSHVFGRKRKDESKVEPAAQAAVPELPPPTSKSLMFKEYAQYPKYAPQMIREFYGQKTKKIPFRPYVF